MHIKYNIIFKKYIPQVTFIQKKPKTFSAGSSGSSFGTKTPSSSAKPQAHHWQSGRAPAAQNKPWMSGSGSGAATKTAPMSQSASAQPSKPNYNLNFSSVIGGREERGLRAPGFGKKHGFACDQ